MPDPRVVEGQDGGGATTTGEYEGGAGVVAGMGPFPTMTPGVVPPQVPPPGAGGVPPSPPGPVPAMPIMGPPEYQYGSPLAPPSFQGVVVGGEAGVGAGIPTYATIISPPMSPSHGPHNPALQAPPQYPGGMLDGQYGSENQE